jgi:hypothetical protein
MSPRDLVYVGICSTWRGRAVGKARNAAETAASLTFLERLSFGIYQ